MGRRSVSRGAVRPLQFSGPAGDSPGSRPAPQRDPYAPRGPQPPDPPPENLEPVGREVGSPFARVCLYLGSVFVLLNVVGVLGLVLYAALRPSGEGVQDVLQLAENLGTLELLALYALSAPFAVAWTVFFRRVLQRRSLTSLGFSRRRWLPRSVVGWVLGVVASGFVLLIGTLAGVYEPHLASPPVDLRILSGLFLGFLLQGGTEELIFRGYAQKNMVEWRGDRRSIAWILVFPSVAFALAHVSNPDHGGIAAANTFLLGFALGANVLAHGDLWAAIGFHAGWNFALAGVWSLPVSGVEPRGWLEVTRPENLPDWAGLLFGGSYGPEGGLVVTLLAVFAISVLLPRAIDSWPRNRWGGHER